MPSSTASIEEVILKAQQEYPYGSIATVRFYDGAISNVAIRNRAS